MRPRWVSVLAVTALVLAVVVGLTAMTAAALPVALVLGATALAFVAGAGGRLQRRAGRRTGDGPGVGVRGPDRGAGSRRRWSTGWESDPPVHAVPDTRERVTAVLAEWGLSGEPVEPTLLVVTELLSNAIDHARGPVELSVELRAEAVPVEAVRVEVRDATPDPPLLRPPDPTRARGRGVHLVEALSLRWGSTADPPGKVVWADVPTRWPT